MRENPYANTNKKPEELAYAGDNFIRYSGSTSRVYESQLFAWQASEKGIDVHLQAEPTKAELLNKQFKEKKEEHKIKLQQSILDKYASKEKNSDSDGDSDADDKQQSSVMGKNW
jgi:pre-mRNA-processing factor SLU7